MRGRVVATVLLFDLATLAHGQVIEKQVLEQVKDATVYITVKAGRLQGSGSGFVIRVTGNTVLVMTNRHVAVPRVGALPPESKVEVSAVFRSGTARQQELPARVLAFDDGETRDLAVLEVRGITAPPRPILADQSAAESDFFETMPVYALGFPLGGRIQAVVDNRGANPAITVTSMSISSLRRDEANRLARVQLNGPLIEGNSGGPVVDAKGRLVGVAVSRVVSESVGFAIPPSVIAAFLGGDIGGLTAEVLAPQGGNAQVKISLRPVDPLGKLQGVAIRYVRLGSSPVPEHHPDAQGRWPLIPGGTSVPLTLGNGRAAGQFSLPAVDPDDRKLIVQFVLTDTAGRITASKPMPVVIPERPGPIVGLGEAPWSQAVARWSCEVNLDGGCKMTHQPGFSTLDLPGGTPMVIAPQNKLYNAPSALVRVDGDFAAAVRVTNDFDPGVEVVALANGRKLPFTYQGAGLLIWQDEKNFVRFERCKGSDGRLGLISRVLIKVYKGGREAGTYYTPALPEHPIVLGAIRKGGSLRLLFATGPDRLPAFKELAIDFNREVYVGISAANLSKRPFQAMFEDFTLRGLDGKVVEVKPVAMTRLIESGAIRRADGTWVFEGAFLKVVRSLGGPAQPQTNMDQFQGNWTDNRQLFWRAVKTGDALTLEMPVESAGTYEVRGKFTIAPDYAQFRFALDGQALNQGKATDLYYKEVRPAPPMSLGSVALTKGKHQFTVTVLGKNPSSSGFNFGLDEIQLVPSP